MGLCGPLGCIMGILSLRGHEERGQHISDLEFRWGSSILHHLQHLQPFSVSLFIPGVPSGGASGSFFDEWKQNKAAMATLHIGPSCLALCPQSTWNSILATSFPLELRMNEPSSLFCFICLFFAPCLQPLCSRILSIYPPLWGQFP